MIGGTHPAALWYTFARTYDTAEWRWKKANSSSVNLGMMNHREEEWYGSDVWIKMLEVDLGRLFDCLQLADAAGADILYSGRALDDATNGGLVFFFTVDGPASSAARTSPPRW